MQPEKYTETIEKHFTVKLNHSQRNQISRLLYEIEVTSGQSLPEIISLVKTSFKDKKPAGRDIFQHLRKSLINIRYPLTSANQKIDINHVFLNPLKNKIKEEAYHPQSKFIPEKIFIEEAARNSPLAERLQKKFPEVEVTHLQRCSLFLKEYRMTESNFKRPLLFVVNEIRDFIKPCPCTKSHIGCGYWIFNLGFGCPFDCSYCYLQQYQNFPGITLPANIDDFLVKVEEFLKKIKQPIRIGTGEFCDSLALDEITRYSSRLIDFFSHKPVFFELKTKSDSIENILKKKPSKNIVISWSLNPQALIESEEYGVASLEARLAAAERIRKHGFSIAFHFDPILYCRNWQELYKELIEKLYQRLKPPFAWISLGTLRFNRELKPVIESRFPKSRIVYAEMFLGKDKKLRYPEFLREDIYKKMSGWIRKFDKETCLYLCMENTGMWDKSLFKANSSTVVEKHLLKTCQNLISNS